MHFYYYNKWQCLEERTNEMGLATKQFVWGATYIDELVCRDRDANNTPGDGPGNRDLEERLFTLQDALSNVTTLVNPSGAVVERYRYAPYGAPTIVDPDFSGDDNGASDIVNEHLYTGRRTDPGSGLQLNRYRYYHALLGRWVNRDPIDYAAGDMNVYAYVNGMPTHSIDPSGLAGGWGGAGHDVLIEDAMDNADTDPQFDTT